MRTPEELQCFKEGFSAFCKEAGLSSAEIAAVTAAACSLGGDMAIALQDAPDGKDE